MAKFIYPLGEQSFKDIREAGMVYVDKTVLPDMKLKTKTTINNFFKPKH